MLEVVLLFTISITRLQKKLADQLPEYLASRNNNVLDFDLVPYIQQAGSE